MSDTALSNSLYISVFEDANASNYYYLSLNTRNLLKFYSTAQHIYYMPSTLEYRLVQQKGGIEETVVGAVISLTVTGVYKDTGSPYSYTTEFVQQDSADNLNVPYVYNFPKVDKTETDSTAIQQIDIDKIVLSASYNSNRVAYEELSVLYGTSEQMAKLSIVANGIYASVAEAGFTFDSNGLTVTNGNIIIKNGDHQVFRADTDGNLYFEGTINSQDGFLSGWILEEDELIDESGRVGIHSGERRFYNNIDTSPVRFWAGAPVSESGTAAIDTTTLYNFAVTEAGTLYANDAEITGAIQATSGRILNTFYVGPNNSTGIIIHGDEKSSYIGSMRYASGALGGGWTINSNGSAEFNNVTVRGKITSSVFEYNHISSIGGSLYVAPTLYTTELSEQIQLIDSATNKYSVTWRLGTSLTASFGNKTIANGYQLLLDGNIIMNDTIIHMSDLFVIATNITDASNQTYLTITFNSDLSLSGQRFEPGTAIVLYGTDTTREGLYLTAMGENSPYLEIYSNNSDEVQPIPAARLGNLSGIVDADFASIGGKLEGYGLYSSNAYLRGQLLLPSAGITNQSSITVNNSAIRIWAGTEATKDITKSNFIVTADGSLYAKQGTFEGVVRAIDSEFSGNIRAAGILLEDEDISSNDSLHDHFYVAYNILAEGETKFNPSYANYVLNIDKDGLSIWEGGLQAYSDFANGENTLGDQQGQLAAYKYNASTQSAFPFLYLIDDGTISELTSRMVLNKLHVVNFTPYSTSDGTKCDVISVQLNNGLWLVDETLSVSSSYKDIENGLFGIKETGLTMQDGNLIFKNSLVDGLIHLTSSAGVCINGTNLDTTKYLNNALLVNGNMQIVDNVKAELKISAATIQEAKTSSGKTIGLNFIAVS